MKKFQTLFVYQAGTVKKFQIDSKQTLLDLKKFFGQALRYDLKNSTFSVVL